MCLIYIIIGITPIAVVIFRLYAKYKLNYWKRRGVEFLPCDLIFGNFKNVVLFKSAPGLHLSELYKAADGPFLGFYIFHKPCLLLRDPEIIKDVLLRDFDNFSDRNFAGFQQKDSTGMKNLFGLKNPAWKYSRSKITPTLYREKIKQMLLLMMEIEEPMMQYLDDQKADENGIKIIDAQNLSHKFTTNLIASVALGTKMDSFHKPDAEFCKYVMGLFHGFKRKVAHVTVSFIPEVVQLIGTKLFLNSGWIRKTFWDTIESREKTGIKRGDFIDSLLKLKNGEQNPDYKFEGENLFSQIGIFFSGFESSSVTMSFTLSELANNPEYQEKARKDINKAIERNGLTYEAFNEMKYLDQCIAEVVRLHPPISFIDRYTQQDYKIPGTEVVMEKGTAVYISLYGLHKDGKFFEDPLLFNPDRFEKNVKISDAYIPFGIGRRMCVGMKVGQLHAKVFIAMILREYEVQKLKDHTASVLNPQEIVPSATNGINLEFKKIVK